MAAASSGADVIIQELEDFTPPSERPRARAMCASIMEHWRAHGRVAAVRVNPLEEDGMADLEAVVPAKPHVIALPKVRRPEQLILLDREVSRLEEAHNIPVGTTELLPNIEYAEGVLRAMAIAQASARVKACLLAAEDLIADLGAVRSLENLELQYCRQRFIVECRAADVVAVDCPFTWQEGGDRLRAETDFARRLGYTAKGCVHPAHVPVVNDVLTPTADDVLHARQLIDAFEQARAEGRDRALVDGTLVEVPAYNSARRLIRRASELATQDR